MSISVTGKVEHKGIGLGAWALVSNEGKTYELRNAPSDLKKADLKVTVKGEIRDDIMTISMIGPVLEVESFEAID